MTEQELRTALERFASKSDDALECAETAAAVLGISQRTLRYHPKIPRVYITLTRYNFRVGVIRKIAREGGV